MLLLLSSFEEILIESRSEKTMHNRSPGNWFFMDLSSTEEQGLE